MDLLFWSLVHLLRLFISRVSVAFFSETMYLHVDSISLFLIAHTIHILTNAWNAAFSNIWQELKVWLQSLFLCWGAGAPPAKLSQERTNKEETERETGEPPPSRAAAGAMTRVTEVTNVGYRTRPDLRFPLRLQKPPVGLCQAVWQLKMGKVDEEKISL